MTDFKYTPEDFECLIDDDNSTMDERACRTANARLAEIKKQWLEELLKDAPVVYSWSLAYCWHTEKNSANFGEPTKQARLVDIREIKK